MRKLKAIQKKNTQKKLVAITMKLDGGGAFEEAGAVEKVEMGGT